MEYRVLGRSGDAVEPINLGGATFGRETNQSASHAVVDRVLE